MGLQASIDGGYGVPNKSVAIGIWLLGEHFPLPGDQDFLWVSAGLESSHYLVLRIRVIIRSPILKEEVFPQYMLLLHIGNMYLVEVFGPLAIRRLPAPMRNYPHQNLVFVGSAPRNDLSLPIVGYK